MIASRRVRRATLLARVARQGAAALLCAFFISPALAASPGPLCLQNDHMTRPALVFAEDGRYAFCGCAPMTVTGVGTVSRRGNLITLEHDGPDWVRATVDTQAHTASATLQAPVRVGECAVEDSNITNSRCTCDFSCILSCPPDTHTSSASGAQGAPVWYPRPQASDEAACGAVTCSIGTGTIFRKGTTNVRCSAEKGAACTFNVTVDK